MMMEGKIDAYPADTAFGKFDKAVEWLLILLLAFTPLVFGAVEAWSEEVVIALAAAISIVFLAKLVFVRTARFTWSWAYVPLVLFILIALLQLVSLPTSLLEVISPNVVAIKRELLGDMPNSSEVLDRMTLTFYRNATKHDLRLVLAVAAIFVVVFNVFRRPDQVKRLLAAIAIIGGGIAFLALAQDLFGNGRIYWYVPIPLSRAYSGTFVNHSHYGQFMNLSIGAALGLIMVKLHEVFSGKNVTPLMVFECLSSWRAKSIWLLAIMIIIGAVTVFVSLTRGGMVSMLLAGAFTALALSSRHPLKGRGWVTALMASGAFICVLYRGFNAVYDRLAILRELHAFKGRWQIVKDVGAIWTKFPVFGTGLGSHEVAYPMFDRSTIPALATHAENEYVQVMEETGLIGLAALVGFAIVIWLNYIRNIRSASVPIQSAAYGIGFGLAAIMVHSLSDFGQHLPANALLSAVFCALLLAIAHTGRKSKPTAKVVSISQGQRIWRIAVLICISAVWAWAVLSGNSARIAEAHWKRALAIEQSLVQKDWAGTNEEYIDLISHTASASVYQPDNIKYRHWLNVYRWRSISCITNPDTDAVFVPERSMPFVRRIVEELNDARLLCPTYGATYCVLGQLEKFILNDPNGAEHIRKAFRLAPCDPIVCYVAGLLDIEEQQIDASFEKFSRAFQLTPVSSCLRQERGLFEDIVDVYVNKVNRPDLALAIAGKNTGRLSHIADILATTYNNQVLFDQARVQVVDLLRTKCQEPNAPASAFASLANVYRRENNTDAAIVYYRRALTLDQNQLQWHFNLARLLAEINKITEAIHEVRICLRLQPEFTSARKLIDDLSVRSEASPGGSRVE